jgi:hypothetical protein
MDLTDIEAQWTTAGIAAKSFFESAAQDDAK